MNAPQEELKISLQETDSPLKELDECPICRQPYGDVRKCIKFTCSRGCKFQTCQGCDQNKCLYCRNEEHVLLKDVDEGGAREAVSEDQSKYEAHFKTNENTI